MFDPLYTLSLSLREIFHKNLWQHFKHNICDKTEKKDKETGKRKTICNVTHTIILQWRHLR